MLYMHLYFMEVKMYANASVAIENALIRTAAGQEVHNRLDKTPKLTRYLKKDYRSQTEVLSWEKAKILKKQYA